MAAPLPAEQQTSSSSIPGLPPDWPLQATNRVVSVVDSVKAKTAGPAIKISRAVVYGVVAALLALITLPLFIIGLVRAVDLIPGNVWIVYFILGGVFTLAGLGLWRLRPRGATRL